MTRAGAVGPVVTRTVRPSGGPRREADGAHGPETPRGRPARATRAGPDEPLGEVRRWPRSFADRLTAPLPGLRALARLAREGASGRAPTGCATFRSCRSSRARCPGGRTTVAVTWAGHASWVIRIGGLTVLTDPVWSRRILGTPARITPVGVAWEELPPVDAVVISHNHYDHLDAPTLRRLPRDTPLFVPAGLARWFRRRRFTRVTELDWWEAAELRGADGVPCASTSSRPTTGPSAPSPTPAARSGAAGCSPTRRRAAGLLRGRHAATATGSRRSAAAIPGIDLALLPIGAYEPRWWLSDVHSDPEEAVRACQDLGAGHMAPMHWATFVLSAEPVLEPLTRVRAAWERTGRPREDLWDLPVGASRVLTP